MANNTLSDASKPIATTCVESEPLILPLPLEVTLIALLLAGSALISGLTIGLLSLTPQELMLIAETGTKREKLYAEKILPVRKMGNYLLCSFLIANVIINSSVSILFSNMTSGTVALLSSTACLVLIGEILPQAICMKKGLAVGARTIYITMFIMFITAPLSYPISKLLDMLLGVESASFNRRRLMELIKLTIKHAEDKAEELKIAAGAMKVIDKTVGDVMTKIQDVFMLPDTTVLNAKRVSEILQSGYTRIPIYSGDQNNVVSLLFVKDLALLDPDDNLTVRKVCAGHNYKLRFVSRDTKLMRMLNEFKKGDYHLAIVQQKTDDSGRSLANVETARTDSLSTARPTTELIGVVTLEDIVEEILQAEIIDETDAVIDNVHRKRRRREPRKL